MKSRFAKAVDATADISRRAGTYYLRFVVAEKTTQTNPDLVTFMTMDGTRLTVKGRDTFLDFFRPFREKAGNTLYCSRTMDKLEADSSLLRVAIELNDTHRPGQREALAQIAPFLTSAEILGLRKARRNDPWRHEGDYRPAVECA